MVQQGPRGGAASEKSNCKNPSGQLDNVHNLVFHRNHLVISREVAHGVKHRPYSFANSICVPANLLQGDMLFPLDAGYQQKQFTMHYLTLFTVVSRQGA